MSKKDVALTYRENSVTSYANPWTDANMKTVTGATTIDGYVANQDNDLMFPLIKTFIESGLIGENFEYGVMQKFSSYSNMTSDRKINVSFIPNVVIMFSTHSSTTSDWGILFPKIGAGFNVVDTSNSIYETFGITSKTMSGAFDYSHAIGDYYGLATKYEDGELTIINNMTNKNYNKNLYNFDADVQYSWIAF